jgi:8-oxo-dGTP pyrophosphatase MutT (NUDIX family)
MFRQHKQRQDDTLQRRSHRVTMGAQAVVLDRDRRVLLVRHSYQAGWHFPGGGVERNETLQQALTRELWEETGIVPTSPRLFAIYSHFDAFPGDHIVLFVVEDWTQAPAPASLEIVERRFFALDALPQGIDRGTRRRLQEVLAGDEPSPAW